MVEGVSQTRWPPGLNRQNIGPPDRYGFQTKFDVVTCPRDEYIKEGSDVTDVK